MISNISLFTLYVTDQDEAKRFYVDVLGFEERSDISMGADTGPGDDFRWVTVGHPSQPELDVTLMVPGPPLSDEMATSVRRALAAGSMGGFGISTDDCRKAYEELSAKGVEFVQEPAERPYGVEAVMRDNSGNWLVIVEPREFSFDLPG
jgi:catechol 2,3-dioxygenase-like lactoylglutathione lyase family enzyme